MVEIFTQSLAEVFHTRVREILFPAGKPRKQVVSTHAAIAQAIIDGDAATAEALMLEHMEAYVRYVEKAHPAPMGKSSAGFSSRLCVVWVGTSHRTAEVSDLDLVIWVAAGYWSSE